MNVRLTSLAVTFCLLLPGVAAAQTSPREQRGQTFVRANCSKCHATDKVSESPLKIAPPACAELPGKLLDPPSEINEYSDPPALRKPFNAASPAASTL